MESDRDIVRGFIQSARGDVESFEAFLVEKVFSDPALNQLAQVMDL